MACDYVLLPRAQADFEEIVRYLSVELDSKKAALRFVEEFESKVLLACEHPEMHPLSQMPEVAARLSRDARHALCRSVRIPRRQARDSPHLPFAAGLRALRLIALP